MLIVDESAESREILSTLLHRQGAVPMEAARVDQAARFADEHQPDVIVLDAESDHTVSRTPTMQLAAAAGSHNTPLIVLGTTPRGTLPLSPGQFVRKPYHYGPLIRRIEELLAAG